MKISQPLYISIALTVFLLIATAFGLSVYFLYEKNLGSSTNTTSQKTPLGSETTPHSTSPEYTPLRSRTYTDTLFGYTISAPENVNIFTHTEELITDLRLQEEPAQNDFVIQIRPVYSVDEMVKLRTYLKTNTAQEEYTPDADGPWWENRGAFIVDKQMSNGARILQWEEPEDTSTTSTDEEYIVRNTIVIYENRYVHIFATWRADTQDATQQKYQRLYLDTINSLSFGAYNQVKYNGLFYKALEGGTPQSISGLSYPTQQSVSFCANANEVGFVFYPVETIHGWCNLLEFSGRITQLNVDTQREISQVFDEQFFPYGYGTYDNSKKSITDFKDVNMSPINGLPALRWTITNPRAGQEMYTERYAIVKAGNNYFAITCFSENKNQERFCETFLSEISPR